MLQAANTGAPLTATGVQALATLRASAKRDGRTVGRFGVGFAAVAAVADEVVVASRTGAVRFSRELTAQAVATLPSLAAELAARDGRVPLLRLPFESDAEPPRGWDTVVRVRVRPSARARVTALLDGLDATLLLVLPGLTRIELPGRVLAAVAEGADVVLDGARWRVLRGEGRLDEALLADRPVEERAATRWSVTWAVPVDDDGVPGPLPVGVAPVVRAPTPTDDPLSTPALLAATLPLGPDRRRVRPGPLADAVLAAAGRALAELLARLAPDPARLLLVPGPLAAGEVDAVLGRALLAALREAPVLPGDRRPSDGLVLEDATDDLVAVLGDVLPGLLPAAWSGRRWTAALTALGTPRLDLAALTEVLAGIDRPPSWWRSVYAALPPDVEQLGALPVPLADGRLAAAPRGLVLTAAGDLSPLGLRVVHPEAAHPLLLRLGAVEAHPRTLLEDPRVRAAVENALDEDDPGPVVEAVLGLVGGAGVRPGELPWLAALPLPDEDGEWVPAGELLLPDGPLAQVVDRDAGFGVVQPGFAHDDVLAAVGVLRGFAVVPVDEADGVDGLPEWLGTLLPGQEPEAVVRDLDLVRPESWPLALDVLRRDDLLRLPYVRWWLAGTRWQAAGAPPISGCPAPTRCWRGCTTRRRPAWSSGSGRRWPRCWPTNRPGCSTGSQTRLGSSRGRRYGRCTPPSPRPVPTSTRPRPCARSTPGPSPSSRRRTPSWWSGRTCWRGSRRTPSSRCRCHWPRSWPTCSTSRWPRRSCRLLRFAAGRSRGPRWCRLCSPRWPVGSSRTTGWSCRPPADTGWRWAGSPTARSTTSWAARGWRWPWPGGADGGSGGTRSRPCCGARTTTWRQTSTSSDACWCVGQRRAAASRTRPPMAAYQASTTDRPSRW